MQEINYWYNPLIGFGLIVGGLLLILKTDKLVRQQVENWPFGKFSNFEIKFMKIMWRIIGSLFIGFGIYLSLSSF